MIKRCWGASGGWRQNDEKVEHMNQGDLAGVWTVFTPDESGRRAGQPGVRAAIVAMKRGNARGAKGRRKVDARRAYRKKADRRECPLDGLSKAETPSSGTLLETGGTCGGSDRVLAAWRSK